MTAPVVYVVTDRAGRVLARQRSAEPMTHAAVLLRWDGRVEVRGWGDRARACQERDRPRGPEIRGGFVVRTSVERRSHRCA